MPITCWNSTGSTMNRRVLFITLLLLMLAQATSGCCASRQFTHDTSTFRVGIIQGNHFPFIYQDDQGQWTGFELAMVKQLGQEVGVEHFELTIYPDQEALSRGLLKGEVDCGVSKLKMNLRDGERLIYSHPYIELDSVFLVNRKLRAQLRCQADCPEAFNELISIGTLNSEGHYDRLRKMYPNNSIVKIADFDQMIDQVISGKLVAGYIDEAQARQFFFQHPEKALMLAYMPWGGRSDSVALAFSWQKRVLREWSNIFLQARGYVGVKLDELIVSE